MALYKFCWTGSLYYPDLSLTAEPGQETEFETPPDPRWVLVKPKAEPDVKADDKTPKRKSAGE